MLSLTWISELCVFPGLAGEKGERGNPGVGSQGPRGQTGLPGKKLPHVYTDLSVPDNMNLLNPLHLVSELM